MEISINDFNKLINPRLIDIRDGFKYNNGHIPGSVNISNNNLLGNPSKYLDKDNIYYIYCQKGITSLTTCQILRALGYNVLSISGGYESYILNN